MKTLSKIDEYISYVLRTSNGWNDAKDFSENVLNYKPIKNNFIAEYDYSIFEIKSKLVECIQVVTEYFDTHDKSNDIYFGKITDRSMRIDRILARFSANFKVLTDLNNTELLSEYGKMCFELLRGLEILSNMIKHRRTLIEGDGETVIHKLPINLIENDTMNNIVDETLKFSRIQFEKLQINANNIDDLKDRIKYWSEEKVKYNVGLDIHTLTASGIVSTNTGLSGEYFLDRLISKEIEHLKECLELENTSENSTNNQYLIPISSNQEKICLLESLGIIDYIIKSQKHHVPYSKVSEFLSPIVGMPSKHIEVALERIRNSDLMERNKEYINSRLNNLKFERVDKK